MTEKPEENDVTNLVDTSIPSEKLAKNRREVLNDVLLGKVVGISRYGKTEAVLISVDRYKQMIRHAIDLAVLRERIGEHPGEDR